MWGGSWQQLHVLTEKGRKKPNKPLLMPSDVGHIYVDQPYNCRTVQCSHAWKRAHVHLPLAFISVCDVGQCVRIPHMARGVGVGGGFGGINLMFWLVTVMLPSLFLMATGVSLWQQCSTSSPSFSLWLACTWVYACVCCVMPHSQDLHVWMPT